VGRNAQSHIASLLLATLFASASRAAVISEVLFQPTLMRPANASLGTAPVYIEIDELPEHPVDLVILSAQSSLARRGLVLQVFTLPASSAVRVLAQGSFSPGMLGPEVAALVTSLPAGVTFNLPPSLPRSIMLFDGVTGLTPEQLLSSQGDKLVGKPLLDVLTFGPGAASIGGEPVWDTTGVTAGSRLNYRAVSPGSVWTFGVPTAEAAIGPLEYRLNPGLPNQALAVPEPAGGFMLALLGGALLGRGRPAARLSR
jgi:hypothetical protein